jgi:hypothetical protein
MPGLFFIIRHLRRQKWRQMMFIDSARIYIKSGDGENEYIASCSVHEDNFSLIDLKITVGTKSDARIICDNWKKHTQAIYAEIIEILTRKREED